MASRYEIGPLAPEEVRTFFRLVSDAFLDDLHDEDVALWERELERERMLVARADGALVAGSGLLTMRMTVPGAVVPMAGLTGVGVDAVHRGRGLLDRMMRAHLEAIHERGEEAVSALWASEAGIYGRWGYGPAARLTDMRVRSRDARLLVPVADRPRAGAPDELLADLRAAYDAVAPRTPGMLQRDEMGWARVLHDPEHRRDGAGRLRAIACDGGYALYAVKEEEDEGRPAGVVRLRELVASGPEAAATLWQHLLGLSLTRSVHWPLAPEDEPLALMIDDQRAVRARLDDGIYVRLVDVGRALAQRRYATAIDLVVDVADRICPWNAGRWRLATEAGGGATCEHTDAPADLALGVTELGAAYLGGTPLALLAAAGRVEERTAGAVAAATHAFRGERAPWCAETF